MVKLKNLIAGGMIIPSLLFGKLAKADESKSLEEITFSPPWISMEYNKKRENYNQTAPDYFKLTTDIYFDNTLKNGFEINRKSNISSATLEDRNKVDDLITKIKEKDIKSYNELINNTKSFSPYQNLLFWSVVGEVLVKTNYGIINNDTDSKLFSQEDFLNKFQKSMNSEKPDLIGRCEYIHSNLEKSLRDSGISNVASVQSNVSGINGRFRGGHVYDIFGLANQTGILDYGTVFLTGTKNSEKILRTYQKLDGLTTFQYVFFENTKFKYRLITPEGKHYLEFIGYDGTTKHFNNIFNHGIDSESFIKTTINEGDYVNSKEINLFGFFFKGGDITGDKDSPLEKMKLHQYGFKKMIILPNAIQIPFLTNAIIGFESSFIRGKIYQDLGKEQMSGDLAKLILSTNNKEGLNIGFELFSQSAVGQGEEIQLPGAQNFFGVSYGFIGSNFRIKPYGILYFENTLKQIAPNESGNLLSELQGGIIFDFKLPKKIIFSVDPNISKRPWETEYGIGAKLKHENFEISGRGYKTNSKYWANPHKKGSEITAKLNFRYFSGEASYKTEIEDYDGEKETERNTNVRAIIKI
jgi:hypothetical protein